MVAFFGRWLIIIGLFCLLAGAILLYAPWLLGWFGHLPGDIRIESERSKVFVPLTSMLVISVILTLLLNGFALLGKFLQR